MFRWHETGFYQIQFERETNKKIEETNQWEIYKLYQQIEEIRINNVRSEWELQQKIYNLQYELRKINESRRREKQFWEKFMKPTRFYEPVYTDPSDPT